MCSVIAVPFVSARQQCSFISLAAHGDHYIPCKCFCYFVSTSDIDCPSGSAVRVMSGLSCSLSFFPIFFLLQIPLKVLNRDLLSSQRDKRQLFLSESSARCLALMQSALHIFFVFLPPSAAVKTENSKSHSRVFLHFFFRVVPSNVTSSTCPTFFATFWH